MRAGFTLLEILVAVGLFATVSTLAVGALFMLSSGQQKIFNAQTSQDNVRFTLETIAREIRVGLGYEQAGICADTSCLRFTNDDGEQVTYSLGQDGGCLVSVPGVRCILKQIEDATPQPVTAPEVLVESLSFIVSGIGASDGFQPRVTIVVKTRTPGTPTPETTLLTAQTTVSQLVITSDDR